MALPALQQNKEHKPEKILTTDGDDVRCGKNFVYIRKTKVIPNFAHVHESNPTLHEVTAFPNHVISSESISDFPTTQ